MHQPTAELPAKIESPDANIQRLTEFGAMEGREFDVVRGTMSAGVDVTGLLEGLEDDLCQCPHLGYIVDGSLHVRYVDGTEEVNEAGEAVYWPPGHTIFTEDESVEFILFSPQDEHGHVLDHLVQKMSEMEAE
jgi:hypothetical protein